MFSLESRLIAGALAVLALLSAFAWWSHSERQIGAQACRAEVAAATIKANTDARAEEQRRTAAAKEIADETYRMATRARADSAAAGVSGARLRDAFAARVAACYPATEPGITPARAGQPNLPAIVFGELEERARGLALEADIRGNAGRGCERQRDELGGTP